MSFVKSIEHAFIPIQTIVVDSMDPNDVKMDENQDGEYFTSYEDLEVSGIYTISQTLRHTTK